MRIIGDLVEGNTVKGLGDYFGGKEGPSKFEWSREDKETGLVFHSPCDGGGYLKKNGLINS